QCTFEEQYHCRCSGFSQRDGVNDAGNTLSGAVFMGLGYWYATPKANRPVADKFNQTETAAG
ncbi:Nitrite reductase activity, partial [human gut metagenome]